MEAAERAASRWRVVFSVYVGAIVGSLLGGLLGAAIAVAISGVMGDVGDLPIDQQSNAFGDRIGVGVASVGTGLYVGGSVGVALTVRLLRFRGALAVAIGTMSAALAVTATAVVLGGRRGGTVMYLIALAPAFGLWLRPRAAVGSPRPRQPAPQGR